MAKIHQLFQAPTLDQTHFESNEDLIEYVMNEIYPNIDALEVFIHGVNRAADCGEYPSWLNSEACSLEPNKYEFVNILSSMANHKKRKHKMNIVKSIFGTIAGVLVSATVIKQKKEINDLRRKINNI